MRQKLLSLIGRIGREARSETTTGKVRRRAAMAATKKASEVRRAELLRVSLR